MVASKRDDHGSGVAAAATRYRGWAGAYGVRKNPRVVSPVEYEKEIQEYESDRHVERDGTEHRSIRRREYEPRPEHPPSPGARGRVIRQIGRAV
jgi:hypothetical protein